MEKMRMESKDITAANIEKIGALFPNCMTETIDEYGKIKKATVPKNLSAEQQKAIDDFISSGELPKRVDDFFVKAINALLKGFEPVVIDSEDLMAKLEQIPPMDEASFKAKVSELISAYAKGKDAGKLRIVVKRKESEV